jgi:hypothetical protein
MKSGSIRRTPESGRSPSGDMPIDGGTPPKLKAKAEWAPSCGFALALLWQILRSAGFPNQFFCDSSGRWIGEGISGVGSSPLLKGSRARGPTLQKGLYPGTPPGIERTRSTGDLLPTTGRTRAAWVASRTRRLPSHSQCHHDRAVTLHIRSWRARRGQTPLTTCASSARSTAARAHVRAVLTLPAGRAA